MRLLIDGDGCPNRQDIIELAHLYQIEVLLFMDFAHLIEDESIEIIQCEVGKDSVDQKVLEYVQEGDLVITQDYGLASLCLMKDAKVLHVSGKRISEDNINRLLEARYMGYMTRKAGQRQKGPKKRTKKDDHIFLRELEKIFIEYRLSIMES